MSRRVGLGVTVALWLLACGSAESCSSVISGGPDAGPVDAGAAGDAGADAGSVDAGDFDAGSGDAGVVDAGPGDAGVVDAGPGDAGVVDAGPGDGGNTGGTLAACATQGYVGHFLDLAYSTTGNVRLFSSDAAPFGNFDAIVVRFTTPAVPGDTASLQISPVAGSPQVFRLATLSTQPCVIATSVTIGGDVVAVNGPALFPIFQVEISSSSLGRVTLQPNTTYYVTYVNRDGFGPPPSAAVANCPLSDCEFEFDFQN